MEWKINFMVAKLIIICLFMLEEIRNSYFGIKLFVVQNLSLFLRDKSPFIRNQGPIKNLHNKAKKHLWLVLLFLFELSLRKEFFHLNIQYIHSRNYWFFDIFEHTHFFTKNLKSICSVSYVHPTNPLVNIKTHLHSHWANVNVNVLHIRKVRVL